MNEWITDDVILEHSILLAVPYVKIPEYILHLR